MPTTLLVWLRNDLRVRDNEILHEAAQRADRVLPVYCFDPRHFGEGRWGFDKTGPFRAQFLIDSVTDLRASLQERGADLIVRQGKPEDVIPELVKAHDVAGVYVHKEVGTEEEAVEQAVEEALASTDAILQYRWGKTLYHADDVPFAKDGIPKVYTPFRKKTEKQASIRATFPAPDALAPLPEGLDAGAIATVEGLGLEPATIDDRAVLDFTGGETAGLERVRQYIWQQDLLKKYKKTRNGLLGADYSSKFSAWLAHGCLSPRTIYDEVKRYEDERVSNKSTYWMIFELIWRDFFTFIARKYGARLFYQSGPMNRAIDWDENPEAFERWATGTTGFPFIDANMRELNRSGFMSNRGRQNVASFLSKNLNLDWRLGASYFEAKLLDYDVGSNWGNWAYNSGVGNDPRNRYFNILSQANRYDKKGAYVKHWLPELQELPADKVHTPWELSDSEKSMYGLHGGGYPEPMIDLEASYERLRNG